MARKGIFIYSTLSAAVVYRSFAKTDGDVPVASAGVHIDGHAGVVRAKTGETPQGTRTEVTAEQLDILRRDPVFLAHEANGYIKVVEHEVDPEVVASDMAARDASAQLQAGDFDEKRADPKETGAVPTPDDAKPAEGAANKRKA